MWERPSSLVAATLDSVKEGILVFDHQLQLVHMSDKLSQMLQIPCGSLAAESSLASIVRAGAIGPDSVATALERAAAAVAGGADGNTPAILTTRDGSRIFSLAIRQIADRYWTAAFEDITADRAANARVMELALRDPLTGLGNRLFFEQRCGAFVRQRARIAMLLLDLDRFKAVNDTLGHPIGDSLLKLVGERLQGCLRTYDITARLGGDEFAVLLDRSVEQVDPAEIARRLIDIIGRPYLIEGNIVHVGASIGIALAPADATEYGELLRKADLALYDAKANGRNIVCFFDNAMEERAKDRRAIEQDIRKALRLREFELHYQPQVDIDTQRLLGFEALLYWRHPARGLMKAMQFARLAEELNLIGKIGEWVLHAACREAARWPRDITVSVSASPSQFAAGGFTAFVARALQAAGLKGHRLVIQVSETVLSRSESQVIATLQELRAMDVRVAMDEFGTGYASLSQIAGFPLDSIKIDKSLLGESVNSARHRAIVRAITALGAGLGISTLADGVETPDQLKTIRSDGCAPLQGYLRSQPIPPYEMDTVIASLSSATALPFDLPITANLPITKGGS